jgi:rhamnogalacturonyl hydrolase YesR
MYLKPALAKLLTIISVSASIWAPRFANGQPKYSSAEYLKRSTAMYQKVWRQYRVPAYSGLFSENYPANNTDSLTYMQGGGVKPKEVSFLWPFSGVLSATNVLLKVPSERKKQLLYLDSLLTGIEKYRDVSRQPEGYQAYPVQFEKADRYYDDNGLVGLDYMEAYLNTNNALYLQKAKAVFKFIQSGWDDQLGGGVYWLEGHKDQKPACSNGMAMLTALKIYQGSKDKYYLQWGLKYYNWMYDHLRDSAGIYANDMKMDGRVNKTFYSYNSGSMMEASVLLYRFTKDTKYLKEAQAIAEGTLKHFGALSRSAQQPMQIDLPWFITVLFRGYEALYHEDSNYKYIGAIEKALNYAWENSRDQYGLVTHSWLPNAAELKKPKALLDEGCIAELYARLSLIARKEK